MKDERFGCERTGGDLVSVFTKGDIGVLILV